MVEEHVEISKVSSKNSVQQRFEEQSVGRISERGVEQVVGVPAGRMAEVCRYPGGTVEARSFTRCTPTGPLCRLCYMSRKGRIFLFEEGQKVDTVAAGCGVTRMAAAGSRGSETEEHFLCPKWVFSKGIASDTSKLKHVSIRWRFSLCVVVHERRRLAPQTFARQMLHPEYRLSSIGTVVINAMLPRRHCLKAL